MPIVPRGQVRVRPTESIPGIGAATAVSRAVSGLGGAAESIGNRMAEEKTQADNAAFVTEKLNSQMRRESERLADIETRGVEVDLKENETRWNDEVKLSMEGAPSVEAQQSLKSSLDNAFNNKFSPGYSRHQSKLDTRNRFNSTKNALDDIQSEVLTGRTGIAEAMARSEAAIVGLAITHGGAIDIDRLRASQSGAIVTSHLNSRINSGSGASVIREINAGKWDSETTTQELAAIKRQAISQIKTQASQAQAVKDKELALHASDLEIMVFSNGAQYADIDKALEMGAITIAKRTQLYKRLDQNTAKIGIKADNITRVKSSIASGIPLDPTSKDDQVAVDDMWDELSQSLDPNDPDAFINNAVSFSEQTGMMPKAVKGMLSAFTRSGTDQQAAQAADLIGKLQDTNSPVLNDIPKEAYALGLSVQSLIKGGVSEKSAVKIARENAFGQTPQDKKATSLILNKSSDDNVSFLKEKLDEGIFDPGAFTVGADLSPAMQAEFEVLLGEILRTTANNDLGVARQIAWTAMQNVWSATTVNGVRQVMKYSPEAMYGRGKDTQWINDQFAEDMGGAREILKDTDTKTEEGRAVFVNQFRDFVTERTITTEIDGQFFNIPTVFDGKFLNENEAVDKVIEAGFKDPITGRRLAAFANVEDAVNMAKDRSSKGISIPQAARSASKPEVDISNFFIVTDIKTARSKQPSYPVFVKNEDGTVSPLLDENNLPQRWKPEFRSSSAYKDLLQQQENNINNAKVQRVIELGSEGEDLLLLPNDIEETVGAGLSTIQEAE